MQTYTLDPKDMRTGKLGLVYIFLLSIGSSVAIRLAVDWFWPEPGNGESVNVAVVKAVAFGILIAAWLAWVARRRDTQRYKLRVDDDEMIVDISLFWGSMKRSVRRGEIIYIAERKHGLVISNYGPILTLFLGWVWIPKKLPEYDQLKLLARNWTKSSIA